MEIADGLFQRETSFLLEDKSLMNTIHNVVFSCGDSLSVMAGLQVLNQWGIQPCMVSGRFTMSPLLITEVQDRMKVPVHTIDEIMTGELNIENIIIAADIRHKRENVKKNVIAWLKRPHLGLVPLFMAGDKQFISNASLLKKELNMKLEIFAINKYEVTQYKEEFSGIKLWDEIDKRMFDKKIVSPQKIERLLEEVPLYFLLSCLGYASYKEHLSNPL
jgi:hypothetical protein